PGPSPYPGPTRCLPLTEGGRPQGPTGASRKPLYAWLVPPKSRSDTSVVERALHLHFRASRTLPQRNDRAIHPVLAEGGSHPLAGTVSGKGEQQTDRGRVQVAPAAVELRATPARAQGDQLERQEALLRQVEVRFPHQAHLQAVRAQAFPGGPRLPFEAERDH